MTNLTQNVRTGGCLSDENETNQPSDSKFTKKMEISGNTVSYKHSNHDEWTKVSEETQDMGENYWQSKPFVLKYL